MLQVLNHTATMFIILLLHNRISCKHNNKLNAWAANNFAPLDMFFLSIIISLTSPKITLEPLFITCFLQNGQILFLP